MEAALLVTSPQKRAVQSALTFFNPHSCETDMNQYALILAGGSGTRFWPLSRDHRPKQLLNMFGEGTLLRQAIDRLDELVPRQTSLS